MAAGKWVITTKAKEYMSDGTIDLDNVATNSFRVSLLASGFSTNAIATILAMQHFATAEVATNLCANRTSDPWLTGVTWAPTGTTMRFDSSGTASWTATGGTLSPAWAVMYYDVGASPTDPILAFSDLNTATIASLTITTGNTFQISFPASGIFKLSGATDPT